MRKILVLPSSLVGELSASYLDRRSFKVRSADAPEEALGMATVSPPALIMFSSDLPNMSPVEFCNHVRNTPKLKATKLLMLTAEVGRQPPELLAEAKPDVHLIQPVGQTALLNAVGALLDVEMRRAPRLRCELLARVTRGAEAARGETPMLANILGLSETGLLLECERGLEIGEVVVVQFVVPDRSLRVALRCMVLRADELQLHYGCEFLDTEPVDRDVIREFVESQLVRRKKVRLRPRRE